MKEITKLHNRFTEAAIDDEIVIMRVDTGDFYSLTGTAAATWRLIDGQRSRAALVAALATEFAGTEEDIASDVDEFLQNLRELELIDVH